MSEATEKDTGSGLLVPAIFIGGFIWIVLDSLFFGLIAGLLSYAAVKHMKRKKA